MKTYKLFTKTTEHHSLTGRMYINKLPFMISIGGNIKVQRVKSKGAWYGGLTLQLVFWEVLVWFEKDWMVSCGS